ncbi:DUF4190 domain-containing protein [Gordonia paraffinivorans]|uniref:DUF4190 domain-containing protein n=2 Tax=Gordonia paraffinivorans TaxID=175628 RepID=UPI001E65A2B2|nr:DUF4190 domain-containing protein [Gordonia paraffinivorans]MCD2147466.1 DUF4190 domain-containing protein [Gordonia paraffinivorans]
MGVDNSTQPFPPADTERYQRWPAVNDLDEVLAAEPVVGGTTPAARPGTRPQTVAPRPLRRPLSEQHAPLPPVGDFWDVGATSRPEQLLPGQLRPEELRSAQPWPRTGAAAVFTSVPARRVWKPMPYVAPPSQRTVAPAASLALTCGLLSLPLTLALGLGAILGTIAIVAGVVGIRQVTNAPASTKGTGRAVTGIICGVGGVMVGGPILAFVLLLAGLL